MAKSNCWEVKKCGRESGGPKVAELGACPAATDTTSNGVNGGQNGGRICWAISGTLCGGKVQGSYAAKQKSCTICNFFDQVNREEGRSFSLLRPSQVVKK